ncbi:MAG: S1 RNA-binding domain-containing protein [Lachnospiraceae bacterium]|nr:S1 RNA-binding domain-containing protein [Lachnospiraceae bacterium]
MLKLGENQKLMIDELTPHGAYLRESPERGKEAQGASPERVLLPKRYVPEDAAEGDPVDVFLYRDSEDRMIATTETPKLMLHRTGRLTVRETGRIGAFLDWGLAKDLLLPFANQTARVHKGDEVLCALIIDRSGRLAATMNVYPYLENRSDYHAGDWVTGTVYEKSDNFGLFVAVDDRYSGLIPKKELTRPIAVGESVRVRVALVQPDGRLSLSLRDKAYLQMDADAERLSEYLNREGRIPFTDKADPVRIREAFGMSKNEFKRAVGRLLKEDRIEIGETEIRLKRN